jgi:hypothetical protein
MVAVAEVAVAVAAAAAAVAVVCASGLDSPSSVAFLMLSHWR